MTETGIIMSDHHPVDILEGKKTQTRRTYGLKKINESPDDWILERAYPENGEFYFKNSKRGIISFIKCPYGQVGSKLYVRETWATQKSLDYLPPSLIGKAAYVSLWYKADPPEAQLSTFVVCGKWRSSIFMPKWASRILLEITALSVERLQEITQSDARCEAPPFHWDVPENERNYRYAFLSLWDSIYDKGSPFNEHPYAWCENPWVFVISLKVVK